jgi:rRNA maturation protein Nop10
MAETDNCRAGKHQTDFETRICADCGRYALQITETIEAVAAAKGAKVSDILDEFAPERAPTPAEAFDPESPIPAPGNWPPGETAETMAAEPLRFDPADPLKEPPQPDAEPIFIETSLDGLACAGVLLAANERFFWPLGLALAWTKGDDDKISGLHIRTWYWPSDPEHVEAIATEEDEHIRERHAAFAYFVRGQMESMPITEERERLRQLFGLKENR